MKARGLTRETIRHMSTQPQIPEFNVGDTIEVAQRVVEGDKERIQKFVGDVIAIHTNGTSSTFTIRRIGAHGVAVERIFPYCTPLIEGIRVMTKGRVRRAKLYYIRERVGKSAIIAKQEVRREVETSLAPVEVTKDSEQQPS